MRVRPLPTLISAAAAVLAMGVGADSQPLSAHAARTAAGSPDLWATINKCDTADFPDTIGIRGSMPGLGKRRTTVAAMRFKVQYRRPDGSWRPVGAGGSSGWKTLGRIRNRVLESGQDFTFKPPRGGRAHRLRGVVEFRWTRRGRVVRRQVRLTRRGHVSSAGADPRGFSAGRCSIR